MKKYLLLVIVCWAFGKVGYSQDPENSIYSVPDEAKLYKVTVWRRVFMQEKQNRAFFARNREISRILIDAVNNGVLIPYKSDSCIRRMTKEEFTEKLTVKTGASEDSWGGGGGGDAWGGDTGGDSGGGGAEEADPWGGGGGGGGDDVWGGAETAQATSFKRDPTEINIMNIKEQVFFDKIRSRMYYEIQSLTLMYEDQNTGIYEPVASFNYQEVEKVFRNNPEKAIWYNRQNPGQSRNMADAFLLRLFHGMVFKLSNPDDITILEEANSDAQLALYLSLQKEYKLAEYESDLWEY